MKRRRRRLRLVSALLAMMALLAGSCMTAYAEPTTASLDLNRTGSISIDLNENESEVVATDGSLLYYQVASVGLDNGNMVYTYTSDFSDCDPSYLDDVSSQTSAAGIADYVSAHAIAGTTGTITDGCSTIGDLPLGVYLISQTGEADFEFSPFLITIPRADGDSWVYDVSAAGKVAATPTPEPDDEDEKVNIAGEKIWDGDEAVSTLVRPEEVIINLYVNVEEETIDDATPFKTTTVSAETDWKYCFTDLDKYDEDGNEIDYSIREVLEEPYYNYYHDSYSDSVYDKETSTYTIDVTNTYETTPTPTEGASGGVNPSGGGSGTTGTTSSPGNTTGSTGNGGSKISPGTSSGTTPSSSTPGTSSTTASTLPQTGQLFWPIPFLGGGGFLCLLVGFILRRSGKRKMAHHAA